MELDRTDRKILSILQQDGRIANVELAERIGLSPTSIGERLKRLQRDGFIEGYGARLLAVRGTQNASARGPVAGRHALQQHGRERERSVPPLVRQQ